MRAAQCPEQMGAQDVPQFLQGTQCLPDMCDGACMVARTLGTRSVQKTAPDVERSRRRVLDPLVSWVAASRLRWSKDAGTL